MKLWTHHPSTFRLNDPDQRIDWTRGDYWDTEMGGFRYLEVLPMLQVRLGTSQFIWCCTTRGEFIRTSTSIDLVEWELDVPFAEILAFYRSSVWEDILWSRSDNWDGLLLTGLSEAEAATPDVGALVDFPLRVGQMKCLGPVPVKARRD